MGSGARKEFCCDAAYEGIGCTCSSTFNSLEHKFKPGTIIGHIYEKNYFNREELEKFSLNFLSEVLVWDDQFVKLRSLELPSAGLDYYTKKKNYNFESDTFQKLISETETYDLNNLTPADEDNLKKMKIIEFLNTNDFNQKYRVGNIVLGGKSWQLQKDYSDKIGEIISINDSGTEMEILWFRTFNYYEEVYRKALEKGEVDKVNKSDRWRSWKPCETTKVKLKNTLIPFIVVLESNLFPESICEGQLYHPLSPSDQDMVEILEVDKDRQWIRVKAERFGDEPQMYFSYFVFRYQEGYVFHSNGHLEPKWIDNDQEAYVEEEFDDFDKYDYSEEPW